jgi:3-hydroxyisobutyrate dehydrogenase
MIGGDPAKASQNSWLLRSMGTHVIHCGNTVGAGQIAKLCNNLLLAISMAGLCEVMKIAKEKGLDLNILTEIINTSSGL